MFADLHIHSLYSDGTYTPEVLGELASQLDLGVLSLTDHDTVEGCAQTAQICQARGIEFIPGAELTAELRGQELHLLAYYVDTLYGPLLDALAIYQTARQNRIREIVARLNQLGVPIAADTVFNLANCRSPGRPHVGRALVHSGHCLNLDEAFDLFLKKHRPAWVPKWRVSAPVSIQLIHDAGGLAVMAHPGLNHYDEAIPELVAAGLDGLECFHTRHTPEATARYLRMARDHHLLVTGGSDCHGHSKGKPTIGTVRLPLSYIEPLRTRARQTPARTHTRMPPESSPAPGLACSFTPAAP